MVSFDAILTALLTPMATVEFWYGVFAAFGARKVVLGLLNRATGRFDDEDDAAA